MKNLTLLIAYLMCTHITLFAQNSTFRNRVDSIFDQLNQSYIPSGILLDRTIQFYDVERYEAVNDSITSFNLWKKMYHTAHFSSFNRNPFISSDSIYGILSASREADVITVVLQQRLHFQ